MYHMSSSSTLTPLSTEPIWLVCGSDENYARPLAVTICSALECLDKNRAVELYVLDNDILPDSKARLERVIRRSGQQVSFHWTSVPQDALRGLKEDRHISVAMFLRLFISDFLPAEARQVLYLDCDLLVLTDIQALHDAALEGKSLGSVRDYGIATLGHSYSRVKDIHALEVDPDQKYFNSGVLVLNLERWRREHIGGRVLDLAFKYGINDQDALNAVLQCDWQSLPLEWNVQGSLLYLHEHPTNGWSIWLGQNRQALLRNAKIVHFSGNPKPWDVSLHHPFAAQWRKTLRGCGWFTPFECTVWQLTFGIRYVLYRVLILFGLRRVREQTD
jgi:lipopolysaccharide biosynthesis glycosyltransferase